MPSVLSVLSVVKLFCMGTAKRSLVRCGELLLLAEEDWNAISETLYLVSIPGMRESIREGLATDLTDTEHELNW